VIYLTLTIQLPITTSGVNMAAALLVNTKAEQRVVIRYLYPMFSVASSTGVKRQRREADHPFPSNAEVKIARAIRSLPHKLWVQLHRLLDQSGWLVPETGACRIESIRRNAHLLKHKSQIPKCFLNHIFDNGKKAFELTYRKIGFFI
jgi:hypothetical protein